MERNAERIVIYYDNGDVVEMEKGCVFHLEAAPDDPEKVEITADMVGMSGNDLYTIVSAAIHLGDKLGMFDSMKGHETA